MKETHQHLVFLILLTCTLIFLSLHVEFRALSFLKYIRVKCEQVRETLGAGEIQGIQASLALKGRKERKEG